MNLIYFHTRGHQWSPHHEFPMQVSDTHSIVRASLYQLLRLKASLRAILSPVPEAHSIREVWQLYLEMELLELAIPHPTPNRPHLLLGYSMVSQPVSSLISCPPTASCPHSSRVRSLKIYWSYHSQLTLRIKFTIILCLQDSPCPGCWLSPYLVSCLLSPLCSFSLCLCLSRIMLQGGGGCTSGPLHLLSLLPVISPLPTPPGRCTACFNLIQFSFLFSRCIYLF